MDMMFNQMPTPGTDPSDFAQDGLHNGQAFGVARDDNPTTLAKPTPIFKE